MTVSPSHVNPVIGAISLLMIAVGAGASGCLNTDEGGEDHQRHHPGLQEREVVRDLAAGAVRLDEGTTSRS
jgi:hypothetical protein